MKIDAIIKSGHNAINTDIHAIKSVSGHVSGQEKTNCINKGHGSGHKCPDNITS